jgi:hypothetical protein
VPGAEAADRRMPGVSAMPDLPVRSVTIAEVIDDNGRRVIEITTDGDPSVWDVLGFLHYADEVSRMQIRQADG